MFYDESWIINYNSIQKGVLAIHNHLYCSPSSIVTQPVFFSMGLISDQGYGGKLHISSTVFECLLNLDCLIFSAGFMGSMVSLRNMRYLSGENESSARAGADGSQTAAISDAQRRQLFTQTGI